MTKPTGLNRFKERKWLALCMTVLLYCASLCCLDTWWFTVWTIWESSECLGELGVSRSPRTMKNCPPFSLSASPLENVPLVCNMADHSTWSYSPWWLFSLWSARPFSPSPPHQIQGQWNTTLADLENLSFLHLHILVSSALSDTSIPRLMAGPGHSLSK